MTFKRSFALAALLAISLSSTTGLARRNPEEPLTDGAMLSKTVWLGVKVALLQQYLTKVAPSIRSQLSSRDATTDQEATKIIMDAIAAGWFVTEMKDYFECVREYVWSNVGSPIAEQLPEPLRSIVCNS